MPEDHTLAPMLAIDTPGFWDSITLPGFTWPTEDTQSSRDVGVDVMRWASPVFPPVPETKDSAMKTPETATSDSPPMRAHPLLFEYLKQFQGWSENDATATFSPEQSMLPPIVPVSGAFEGLDDPYGRDMASATMENDNDARFPYSAARLQLIRDRASMEAQSFFGNQGPLPPDFVPMQSNNNEQFVLDTVNVLPPANGAAPDYAWQQFLSRLFPQDSQTSEATS